MGFVFIINTDAFGSNLFVATIIEVKKVISTTTAAPPLKLKKISNDVNLRVNDNNEYII